MAPRGQSGAAAGVPEAACAACLHDVTDPNAEWSAGRDIAASLRS
jgi:hypothetical protein